MAISPPKQAVKAEVSTFVKGLITEASPLNFPQDASFAEENFELNRDGTRDRRRGIGFETPFSYNTGGNIIPAAYASAGIATYVWKSPGGFTDKEFLVVQLGNTLLFYSNQEESMSAEGFLFEMPVINFSPFAKFSFGVANGTLVVVAGSPDIAIINYTLEGFSISYSNIKVRDFWGLQEEEPYESQIDLRVPATSSTINRHLWNLQNQGWGIPRQGEVEYIIGGTGLAAITFNPGVVDVPNYFNSKLGGYPANTESINLGLQFQPAIPNVVNRPNEQVISALYNESRTAGVPAAKGHYIIDLLRRGQSRIQAQADHNNTFGSPHNLGTTNADYSPGGATCAVGFSGRIFYAGFSGEIVDKDSRSPSLESFVVFSQLVKNNLEITKCYQAGDPTSRDDADIVDTDGGYIRISGAAKIVAMRPLGTALIVFATNGIWRIDGGSDYGFSASNYKVSKMSQVGAFTEGSIVEEKGRIFFWALDGIYVIANDQLGQQSVESITQTTIQSYYDSLSTVTKERAIGVYDLYSKKVRWIYNEGIAFTSTSLQKELILDTVLGAFYLNRIADLEGNTVQAVSLFATAPFRTGFVTTDVVVNGDPVVAGADGLVDVTLQERLSSLQSIKYLTILDVGETYLKHTFSSFNNTNFLDWSEFNGVGVDAKAYLITGYQTAGDSSVAKQAPYLTVHFRRTENGYDEDGNPANPSGCLIRSQWDFSNTATSNKWGSLFQAYRYHNSFLITSPTYDNGFELITTKNKLRGRGKSFSLYMESEPLKDLRLVGWNIALNGNQVT